MNAPMPVFQRDSVSRLEALRQIERKLLWLSAWMVHQANHVRPNRDGLKVGGHQASCASVISIMTALYFDRLRPQDGRGDYQFREPDTGLCAAAWAGG
jgi:pyruvate dehydrogenase E1 component